jgi:hypothetical protein
VKLGGLHEGAQIRQRRPAGQLWLPSSKVDFLNQPSAERAGQVNGALILSGQTDL